MAERQFYAFTNPTPERGYVGYAQGFITAGGDVRLTIREHGKRVPGTASLNMTKATAREFALSILAECGEAASEPDAVQPAPAA